MERSMRAILTALMFLFALAGGWAIVSDIINFSEGRTLEFNVLQYLSAGWFFIYGDLREKGQL